VAGGRHAEEHQETEPELVLVYMEVKKMYLKKIFS
jgi:hypothetical protein